MITQEKEWNKLVSQSKKLEGNLPKTQSTIVKRSFKSSTKLLFLDFINPVDKLTAKTFYHFKTSEYFNIWMLYPQSQLEPPIDLEEPLEGFL